MPHEKDCCCFECWTTKYPYGDELTIEEFLQLQAKIKEVWEDAKRRERDANG